METSNEINELISAMVKFQSEVESPKKSTANPAFKREGKPLKYADLDAIVKVVTPALSKHGLSQMQFTSTDIEQKSVTVTTMILHSSGQFIKSDPIVLPAENFGKFNAQTIGSSITYGRRYSLSAMLGIASEDDDDANTQSLPDISSKKPEPKPQQNTFNDDKKTVMDRISKLAVDTGKNVEGLMTYIIGKANENLNRSDSDITPENISQVIGVVKSLEIKAKNMNRQNAQAKEQQQQGSMLNNFTAQPTKDINWGQPS